MESLDGVCALWCYIQSATRIVLDHFWVHWRESYSASRVWSQLQLVSNFPIGDTIDPRNGLASRVAGMSRSTSTSGLWISPHSGGGGNISGSGRTAFNPCECISGSLSNRMRLGLLVSLGPLGFRSVSVFPCHRLEFLSLTKSRTGIEGIRRCPSFVAGLDGVFSLADERRR